MDGLRVLRLEDILPQLDILITATGTVLTLYVQYMYIHTYMCVVYVGAAWLSRITFIAHLFCTPNVHIMCIHDAYMYIHV